MGLEDDGPTAEATPQLSTIKTESKEALVTNDSYQIVSTNPDMAASTSRKTVYNSVNHIKTSQSNSFSKSPKNKKATPNELSSTADPVTPDLPANMKETTAKSISHDRSNGNIIIQDNN